MIRQIASLSALAGLVMIGWAQLTLSAADIAPRLVAVHGVERAAAMAGAGTGSVMLELIGDQLAWAAFYVIGGAAVGVVARHAVAFWVAPAAPVQDKVAVSDAAGGRYVMYGLPFSHAPSTSHWPVVDVTDVPGADAASVFELEMLGAYRAGAQPADVQGYHGTSLFEHSLGVWTRAVAAHGACSLESILAVAHDAGKMLTFTRNREGTWTRSSPRHEMYNPEAVRRVPSFWALPADERNLVLVALHYMAGGVAAKDVSPNVVTAVQRVRSLDVRTTASETQERRAGQVDLSAIMNAVVELSKSPPEDWNVNRSQSASSPAGAIHIGNGQLLVAGRAIRTALAQRLDSHSAATLSLHVPSADWHEAYEVIALAVQQAGLGARIVNNVASESGWFTVRVGAAKMPYAIALNTQASPAMMGRWGTNQLEIVLTEARKK